MTEAADIKRYSDGSIDIAHYAKLGRGLHAAAVRAEFGRFCRAIKRALSPGAKILPGPRPAVSAPIWVADVEQISPRKNPATVPYLYIKTSAGHGSRPSMSP